MSFPDHNQRPEDHQSLLILVKPISSGYQITQKTFNKIYDRISRIQEIKIQDAQGMGFERLVRLRYAKNEYEPANNEWGDFQAHRKLLGLVTVAKISQTDDSSTQQTLNSVYNEHKKIANAYSTSIYDSRCFVFGSSPVVTPASTPLSPIGLPKEIKKLNESIDNRIKIDYIIKPTSSLSSSEGSHNSVNQLVNNTSEPQSSNIINPTLNKDEKPTTDDSQFKSHPTTKLQQKLTQCIFYPSSSLNSSDFELSAYDRLEQDMRDLVSSLFWVLESKRLDRSYEKQEKIPLLLSPSETKTIIGVDTDTKSYKKKCLGRMRKHVADLSLLAGLPSEALIHYGAAIETFRAVNDWLWLASALEGQCVSSLSLLYPQRRKSSLQRNASLPPSRFKQLQNDVSNTPNSISKKLFFLKNSNIQSLSNGIDPMIIKALGKCLLISANDIYERYKESCCHYAKYKDAVVIELECSFKASRVLSTLEKYMWASEFLHNAVFICLKHGNEEQIKRHSMISQLYSEIGYHRKAAFHLRLGAFKAVVSNAKNQNWEQCYYLLLPALDGYKLTLDPREYARRIQAKSICWSSIHLQLLHELVTTTKRMETEPLAIRHLSFLLHSLFEHLTPAQRKDYAHQLEALSSKCGEGAPVPLTLENGVTIPSVNFTKFPYITSFKVENLPPHLRPSKLKSKRKESISTPNSPFIFTPLQLNRPLRRTSINLSQAQLLDFKWVEGELCRVSLVFANYMPIELNVGHMILMTDGVPFETCPTSLKLAPDSIQNHIDLSGIPRANGKLDILGYATHVLGLKSNCFLRDLIQAKKMKLPSSYSIEVIPQLPLLNLICNKDSKANLNSTNFLGSSNIISNLNISLYVGQSKTCYITLKNATINHELIELITVYITNKSKEVKNPMIKWSDDDIHKNLPLPQGSSFDLEIIVTGINEFVMEIPKKVKHVKHTRSAATSGRSSPLLYQGSNSLTGSPVHSAGLPSSRKHQLLGSTLANFLSDLQAGNNKNSKTQPEVTLSLPSNPSPKVIEFLMEFEYSGGPGLSSGFCRRCALSITLNILPSLLITYWDVLPAETSTHCYLVLDIYNATAQEMELQYSANKSILIETRETCRIPVPVERCPITDHLTEEKDFVDYRSSIRARCKAHLMKHINLRWILFVMQPGLDISGEVSIENIPWTNLMLDAIIMSSIQWDIRINGKTLEPEEEHCFKVGELISLNVSMNNCSGSSLKSLCLWVQCYQDYQNGNKNYRLDMKRAVIGSDKLFINEIQAKHKYNHDCGFVFFYSGLFKIDIQCSGFDSLGISETNNQGTTDLYHQQQQNLRAEMMMLKANQINSNVSTKSTSQSPSLWKCTPSIELRVID